MRCACATAAFVSFAALVASAAAQPCEWLDVGGGMNVEVFSLASFDGSLYAGGAFLTAGGNMALRIARWDGQKWWRLGEGLAGPYNSPDALALAVYDDGLGGGPALYVGGTFQRAGLIPAHYIARWNGTEWSSLGTAGTGGPGVSSRVWALAVFDGALHAGGSFTSAGGVPTPSRIARWNGLVWQAVGQDHMASHVRALAVYQNALHAGFWSSSGAIPDVAVARWDGQSWTQVGGTIAGSVYALTVFDGDLHAGGDFTAAGGTPATGIARWNGQTWSGVGGGVAGTPFAQVRAMTVFDDGTGNGAALYVGGAFDSAGGVPANRIARWDGKSWSPLGAGVGQGFSPVVWALAGHMDVDGPALYAGGSFVVAGSQLASFIARWRCEGFTVCYPNCDGSTVKPILNIDDFTCYIQEYAAALGLPHAQQIESYANCDGSTVVPVLNIDDFTCFINAFAVGCP